MASLTGDPHGNAEVSLLDQFVDSAAAQSEVGRSWARDLLREFVAKLRQTSTAIEKDVKETIKGWMAEVDGQLSLQLSEIMCAPAFLRLEGSWRGLHYLVRNSEVGDRLKIRVINVSKKDLLKDQEEATNYEEGALFQKVYKEVYGRYRTHPFSALIGDYEFGPRPQDVELLTFISQVAAAAHAPFIASAAPGMLGLDSYQDLKDGQRAGLKLIHSSPEYAKWRQFRELGHSRYVGLTLPRVLLRPPYRSKTCQVEAFEFTENENLNDARESECFCWGSAAWAFGTRLTEAFVRSGWLAGICGLEHGAVEGLPSHPFAIANFGGRAVVNCPAEIAIPLNEKQGEDLRDAGFIPLLVSFTWRGWLEDQGKALDAIFTTFMDVQSVQKPEANFNCQDNISGRLSTSLQYILCASRFVQHIKVKSRDAFGFYGERHDYEVYFNRWIMQYVLADTAGGGVEATAARPLAAARVEVEDIPGRPGSYRAITWLQPRFELDELEMPFRLEFELPDLHGL